MRTMVPAGLRFHRPLDATIQRFRTLASKRFECGFSCASQIIAEICRLITPLALSGRYV
jgi:hypothetical protein